MADKLYDGKWLSNGTYFPGFPRPFLSASSDASGDQTRERLRTTASIVPLK